MRKIAGSLIFVLLCTFPHLIMARQGARVKLSASNAAKVVRVNGKLACFRKGAFSLVPGRISGNYFIPRSRYTKGSRTTKARQRARYLRERRICRSQLLEALPAVVEVVMEAPKEIELAVEDAPVRSLEFQVTKSTSHGTLEKGDNGQPGRYRYTPHPGFIGEDFFEYIVRKNDIVSAPAAIHLRVMPVCAVARASEEGFFEKILEAVRTARPRLLASGNGFSETATPDLPAQGDPEDSGYNQMAIARWNTVPFQEVMTNLFTGVVAFHMSGIDRVEFSLNAGPWVTVREASLNPYSCTIEYWATVESLALPGGPSEIRAIAYPAHGIPRVLQGPVSEYYIDASGNRRVRPSDNSSLFLFANARGTLRNDKRHVAPRGDDTNGDGSLLHPFATIKRALESVRYPEEGGMDRVAGAEIFLAEGTYSFYFPGFQAELSSGGNQHRRYVTLRSEPGLDRDKVVIGQGYRGVYAANLHLKDLKVDVSQCLNVAGCHPLAGKGGVLWLDNVHVQGLGMEFPQILNSDWSAAFFTEAEMNDSQTGIMSVTLARNVLVTNSGEDSFKFADVIVNGKVRNITWARDGYHPDVWQYFGPIETMRNLIVYGLDAQQVVAQGVGAPACDGCAFVNVYINNQQVDPESVLQNLQFGGLHRHTYIKNACLIGRNNFRDDQGFAAQDVVAENSFFATAAGTPNGFHRDVLYRNMTSSCADAVRNFLTDLGRPSERTATPFLNPPPGVYQGSVTVAFSTATEGAELRYTLDGTTPGLGSTLYTSPLTVAGKTRFKVRAFKYGMLNSDVVEAYYTIE